MVEICSDGGSGAVAWSIPKRAGTALDSVLSGRRLPRRLRRAKNSQALLGRAIGETDRVKLKRFALNAAKGVFQHAAARAQRRKRAGKVTASA
jgi:hypothetical protein